MSGERPASRFEPLIGALSGDLKPVRRLPPPLLRAVLWLAAVVAVGIVLVLIVDTGPLLRRLLATPDLLLAALGSALTAILAAYAAFRLSLPDAPRALIWLPAPGALLWLGASGLGCLRSAVAPETHVALLAESRDCLSFIVGISLPLSVLLVLMLRRGCSLQPGPTAVMAGLAAAAAAATLLNLCHPFDAALTDLVVHAVAVGLVIGANRILGGRLLRAPFAPAM